MEKFSPFHFSSSPSVTESDSETDHRCTRSDEDVGTYIDRYDINPAEISQILADDAGIQVSSLEGQVYTCIEKFAALQKTDRSGEECLWQCCLRF